MGKAMKRVKEFLLLALTGAMVIGCSRTYTHQISKDEARVALTAFVNQQFERKTLADARLPREGRLGWPRLSEQDWRLLKFSNGRWVIATEPQPPGAEYTGFYARASVDASGENPMLEAARFYLP